MSRARRTGDTPRDDALSEAVSLLRSEVDSTLGSPVIPNSGRYSARIGDLVCMPTAKSAAVVLLPNATRNRIGGVVTIKKKDSDTNAITVLPAPEDLIDKQSSDEISVGYGCVTYVVTEKNRWSRVPVLDTSGSSSVDSGGEDYLTTTLPTGVSGTIEALYQFDGGANSLTDRSSNSNDLTASTTVYYTPLRERVGALFKDMFLSATADSSFQLTGAVTIEVLLAPFTPPGTEGSIVTSAISGETEATNALYTLRLNTAGGSALASRSAPIEYIHEYGAGSNEQQTLTDANSVYQEISLITMTRDSAGTDIKVYIDGKLADTFTASNAPTGGGSGLLYIGGVGASQFFYGIIFCLRITDTEFTAAQVLAAKNTLKPY